MSLGNDIKRGIDGTIALLYNTYDTLVDYASLLSALMTRPIGLANPYGFNYANALKTLEQNIGGTNFMSSGNKNKYGTPIGGFADPYGYEYETSVAKLDHVRNQFYDYIDYMDNVFYDGTKDIPNKTDNGIRIADTPELKIEKAKIGAIRKIPELSFAAPTSNNNVSISFINPNRDDNFGLDTRTGVVSNYYLVNTLQTTKENQEALGYSSTITSGDSMTVGAETDISKGIGGAVITRGVYEQFGFKGEYGMLGGKSFIDSGLSKEYGSFAKPNKEVTGDIIPWSTSDHVYDSLSIENDVDRVNNLQKTVVGEDKNKVKLYYTDLAQNTGLMHEYFPFGNYYSLTYSLGLIGASGGMTQNYTAYSMLGYPLSKVKTDVINNSNQKLSVTELLTSENVGGKVHIYVKDKNGVKQPVWEPYPRKYYVTNGSQGTNYLDQMTGCVHGFEKFGGDKNGNIVRIKIIDPGNDNMWTSRAIFEHIEAEGKVPGSPLNEQNFDANPGIGFGRYKIYDPNVIGARPDIIAKNDRLFSENKIKSIIGRFHTDMIASNANEARNNLNPTSTAISKYGMSRGRNLLRRNHGVGTNREAGNGYDNPYCRVWTYHKQYHRLEDTIRPFEGSLVGSEVSRYRTPATKLGDSVTWEDGQTRLEQLGVKNKENKLVAIAPTREGDVHEQLKHLMFSIENLAWKGYSNELSKDQQGPMGGRIMWFPPYNLSFTETTNVQWEETNFIGRGEPIPTYVNSKRTGNLQFDLLIDHPSILNSYSGSEIGGEGIGDVDDTESYEQMLLRFFAGCEVLGKSVPTIVQQELDPVDDPRMPDNEEMIVSLTKAGQKCILNFFVFFPNNYSGVDDVKKTQRITLTNNLKDKTIIFPIVYLLKGNGANYCLKDGDENQTTWDFPNKFKGSDNYMLVGYEMGSSGLSGNVDYPSGYTANYSSKPVIYKDEETGEDVTMRYQSYVSPQNKKWAYRVDKVYEHQILNELNYVDNKSEQLNSTNYLKAFEIYGVDSENGVSFTDAFIGFECNSESMPKDNYLELEKGEEKLYDDANIQKVYKAIQILKNSTSKRVVVSGFASNHGYTDSNLVLAENRKNTIKAWLETKDCFNNASFELGKALTAPTTKDKSVNEIFAKLGRAAYVSVYCTIEDVDSNINVADNETQIEINKARAAVNTENADEVFEDANLYNGDPTNEMTGLKSKGASVLAVSQTTIAEYIKRQKEQEYESNNISDTGTYDQQKSEEAKSNGYKTEYTYFESLKRRDPFLHDKLIQKIKYFDPAFHSMTPEGFQSRLTFLMQCCKQGNTISRSDGNGLSNTAENLAFGRPPILVLRVGDFYNNKIIINNISFDYKSSSGGGVQWDLNDEGIGVMPMYATINMSITFLGGSDLGGPIQRLQNAMSFNYFANTSVYDNRAEKIEYGEYGTGEYTKFDPYRIK